MDGSTITISSRTTKKLYPRYCGTISTTSAERLEVEDKVPLITVHSAKGTEAKVCYVIQAEPGQYPFFWNLGDRAAEEEDRRVLYVAMTRAKDELIITRTNSYRGSPVVWGGAAGVYSYGGTPYFLQELPANVVVRDAVDFTGITYSGSQVTVPTRRCPPRGDATCRCCHKRSYMRVLSGDIGLCDNCWPSDAQLSYAVSLGIDVPSDVSRNRLSDLISEYQESKGIWRESRLELSHGTQPIQVPDGSGSTEEQYDVFSERPARRAVDRMLSTDDPRERHKSKTLSEPQLNDLRETKREFEGLSEDALILLHGREQCWGLLLFFQVLNDEMARYERLRNATVFGAGYSRDKLLSPYYRPSWIKRIMDEMVRVVRAMAKLLESTKNYAGEPSSAVAIVRSAKKLGLLYEQLLELSFECATTCPDPRFDRAWHVLSDEIRAVASQLKAFGISSIAAIREIVAAPDTGVQKSLTLTFVPQFDVEGFDHEVTKAIEGMYP